MSNIDYLTNINPHQYSASQSMIRDMKAENVVEGEIYSFASIPILHVSMISEQSGTAARLPRAIERVNMSGSVVHEVVSGGGNQEGERGVGKGGHEPAGILN